MHTSAVRICSIIGKRHPSSQTADIKVKIATHITNLAVSKKEKKTSFVNIDGSLTSFLTEIPQLVARIHIYINLMALSIVTTMSGQASISIGAPVCWVNLYWRFDCNGHVIFADTMASKPTSNL